ncbi:MFS general substrate transporter [Fomitiporia mediterranea MF3/22]|uniref:MFS general substrate transporter n=1 Tax=Fomitiporia mediterranea (strain MF3/22) TaxID=694068 RepID=UPI0004409C6B|nr:MFS general substrate transporter [Fomitiporia mediterranea MF3/22]EJD05764.1 MFS general substrate transporter [Fomitiporia mediterranea MF3/22]
MSSVHESSINASQTIASESVEKGPRIDDSSDGKDSDPTRTRAKSIDEKTLNDPESLVREEREATRAAIQEPEGKDDVFPDGGLRAWLVILGGFCTTFSSFGFVNAWGAFQSYYEQTLLQDSTTSNIAWIGSIQYALTFLPSIITGRLFDLGYFRLPLLLASCLMVIATFLTAQCTEYWQFLLCQGFAVGLASGVIFGPTIAVISHWFKRRRGLALGLIACGSSTGGTIFPIAFHNLVDKIGFHWTMRVMGFILIGVLGVANLTLARRLPPVHVSGGLLNLRAFKSLPYSIYTISGFMTFLGLYTVLTYIDVSAASNGVDDSFAFYLVAIANASSMAGRLMAGYLADKIGAINVMAPFTLVGGIMTYIWPFVRGKANYIAIAVFYGMASGAYVSLLAAPLIALGDTSDVGRRTGMFMSILAFGAVAGPPISGAINEATGGYTAVGIYAGSAVVVAVAVMWISRCLVLGRFWGRF